MSDKPQVWIGCLGCYNAGTLTGLWFDAIDCPTDMAAFNEAIGFDEAIAPWERGEDVFRSDADGATTTALRVTVSQDHGHPVYGPHEELWVMDHENFDGFLTGECSPDTAQKIAEWMSEHEELDLAAFGVWLANNHGSLTSVPVDERDDLVDAFQETFAGTAENVEEWAWEHLEGTGYFNDMPEHLETHKGVIVKDWIQDVENGGSITTESNGDGGIYIFWNG